MKYNILILLFLMISGKITAQFSFPPNPLNTTFVRSIKELPQPNGGVITLKPNHTYFLENEVNLNGNRLVTSGRNTIIGYNAEVDKIVSTGLSPLLPLIESDSGVVFKNITLAHGYALKLEATNTGEVLLTDNLTIRNSDTSVISKMSPNLSNSAFINSKGFYIKDTLNSFACNNCLFSTTGTMFNFSANTVINTRIRFSYSSFICTANNSAFNIPTSIGLQNERFVLSYCNFGGGGNYIVGINHTSPKANFTFSSGITNTLNFTAWDTNVSDDFDGTWNSLTGKPTTFTPSAHTHTIPEVSGLQSAIDSKQDILTGSEVIYNGWDKNVLDDFNGAYSSLTGIPATFTPSAHTHIPTEITGLQSLLDGKFDEPLGTTSQYVRGDGSLATFPTITGESTTVTNTTTVNLTLNGTQISANVNDGSITPAKLSQTYITTESDPTVTETLVDGFVSNNGYLIAEVDGSTTNEIQNLSLVGNVLSISNGTGATFTNWDTNAPDDLTVNTPFTGDISGNYNSLQINTNAVTSTEIANGAITQPKLAQMGASNGQVLKWNNAFSTWEPSSDLTGGLSNADYGDITVSNGAILMTIDPNVVSNDKLAQVATTTFKGRQSAGTGNVEDMTLAQVRTMLNLPTRLVLAANATSAVTTLLATTLLFPADANSKYYVKVYGKFQTPATTTGIGLGLDIPSGTVTGTCYHPISATALGSAVQTTDNAAGATTGVIAINTNYLITGEFMVNTGATGGNIVLGVRSEIAASTVTLIGDDFYLEYIKL